ncbi:MAG: 50S ribosomal protein L24 [Candidatus Kerfeldbacteria bacterium]|nr:50S ribosomal protein L24 [Candidatus Kerfeldbacteria bacterium]
MISSRIKKGDLVQIVTGKDRGKRGKVLQVLPQYERIVVENLNLMTKNVRARREREKGQRIQFAGPVHYSNVQLVCGRCGKLTRPGIKLLSGKKVRICAKCHETL